MSDLVNLGVLVSSIFALLSVLVSRECTVIGLEKDKAESKFLILENFTKSARKTCFDAVIRKKRKSMDVVNGCEEILCRESEARIRLDKNNEHERKLIKEMVVVRNLALNLGDDNLHNVKDISDIELKYNSGLGEINYSDIGYKPGETYGAFFIRKVDELDKMIYENDKFCWEVIREGGSVKRFSEFFIGFAAGSLIISVALSFF